MAGPPRGPRPRGRRGALGIEPRASHLPDPQAAPAPFAVLTAGNASLYTLAGTNTYALGSRTQVVVIDPGPDDAGHVSRLLEYVAASGRRVGSILLSHGHSDHRGAADALARETGAAVRGWSTTAAPLRDDERIAVDGGFLRVLYTPGHAPDHVVFHWENEGVLFSGDLILGAGTVNVTPPGGSMTEYLRSLERIERLTLTLIAPGHGPLIRTPHQRIREYLTHRRRREQQILELLTRGPQAVPPLAAAIYPDLDPRLRRAAEGTVAAHLDKLVEEGRVRRMGETFAIP